MTFYYSQSVALFIMTAYLVNALLQNDWYYILASLFGIIAITLSGALYSHVLYKFSNYRKSMKNKNAKNRS